MLGLILLCTGLSLMIIGVTGLVVSSLVEPKPIPPIKEENLTNGVKQYMDANGAKIVAEVFVNLLTKDPEFRKKWDEALEKEQVCQFVKGK